MSGAIFNKNSREGHKVDTRTSNTLPREKAHIIMDPGNSNHGQFSLNTFVLIKVGNLPHLYNRFSKLSENRLLNNKYINPIFIIL